MHGDTAVMLNPSLASDVNDNAYVIQIPSDCVGVVIGKGGETIKMLQEKSGARKVQVSKENEPGTQLRNVYIKGGPHQIEEVRRMLQDIITNQQKIRGIHQQQRTNRTEYSVPLNVVGMIIGKSGETIKGINARTGAFVCVSKEPEHLNLNYKVLLVSGPPECQEAAKLEIQAIMLKQSQSMNMGQYSQASSLPVDTQQMAQRMGQQPQQQMAAGQQLPG